MVSSSQQFERIRKRKATKNGKWNKRARRASGTPAFPVHPQGYDPRAADARPAKAADDAAKSPTGDDPGKSPTRDASGSKT